MRPHDEHRGYKVRDASAVSAAVFRDRSRPRPAAAGGILGRRSNSLAAPAPATSRVCEEEAGLQLETSVAGFVSGTRGQHCKMRETCGTILVALGTQRDRYSRCVLTAFCVLRLRLRLRLGGGGGRVE